MPVKSAKLTPPDRQRRWQAALPGLLIALLVVVAYLPALHGQFIWDDDFHVVRSMPLRSLGGLWRIWFVPGATQQYYPLTHSSFWVDYHLWGLNTFGYHAENILLHAIDAILLWQILKRLNVTGAWLGAALFALHPVGVESVAWISERKNTLSGLFFLLAVMAAIEFWLPRGNFPDGQSGDKSDEFEIRFGPWKYYWLALGLFLCALFSKTTTAVLPGVILILAWWKRGRVNWKDGALVLPFLALGFGIGLFTVSIEHKFILDAANVDEWKLSLTQKLIIAGRNIWFYLAKLLWPHPLMFVYPRWVVNVSQPAQYLALAAAGILFLLLWLGRNTAARPVLIAAGYFVVALFPALGFINIFPFRYSFVADHFQYLAAIGPLALAGAGITMLLSRLSTKNAVMKPVVIGALLVFIGALSWRQTGIYQNLEVLWRDTLARNPAAWMAHDNLGLVLTESQRFNEADEQFRQAIAIRPNDHIAYYDLGLKAAMQGNLGDAIQNFYKTLDLCPNFAMANYQIGNALARETNWDDAIHEYTEAIKSLPTLTMAHFNLANAYAQKGDAEDAIKEYQQTLGQEPNYIAAHIALGRVLAGRGDFDGAIGHYREALEIDPSSVEALANLANALVSKNQLDEAIQCYRAALQLDPNSPVLHFDLSVALSRQGHQADAQAERAEAQRLRNLRAVGR